MSKHCVCGKVITSQFDLCGKCESEYGLDRSKWPEWLVFMVADIKHEFEQDKAIRSNEVTFTGLGLHVADGPEFSLNNH